MSKIEFKKFWEIWPKKVDKQESKKLWDNLSLDQQQACMMAVARKKVGDSAWSEKKYIPSPARFLRREKWDDEDQRAQPLEETQIDDGTTFSKFWNMLVQLHGKRFEREYGPVMPILWRQGLAGLTDREAAKILAMLGNEPRQRLPDLADIRRLRNYARAQVPPERQLPPPPRNEKLAFEAFEQVAKITRRGLHHRSG